MDTTSKHRISVFGLGYVGAVTAACFSRLGHEVIGADVNPDKVAAINAGRSPIVEPQVPEAIAEAHDAGLLSATNDPEEAVLKSDVSIVCVGTPSQRNGKLELAHIEHVAQQIGLALRQKRQSHVVVFRSTVLPGTTENVVVPIIEEASGKHNGVEFSTCFNPEFMREATAVSDFMEPLITVIGAQSPADRRVVRDLYRWVPGRVFETTLREAEMVKYTCNCYHALKAAFANEIGTMCKEMGIDAEVVTEMFVSDTKLNISPAYLKPGFAFGGSCLPKDLRALNYKAKELDLRLPVLQAILPSNEEHTRRAVDSILMTGKRKIGFLGLSFKSGTDDLRESPSVQVIKHLLGEGRTVKVWDDSVSMGRLIGSNRQFIEDMIPHIGSLLCGSLEEVLRDVELVVIGTKAVKSEQIEEMLQPEQMVIDLVNLEKPRRMARTAYAGICW